MIPICIYRMRCNSSARVALFLFYNLHGSYHLPWRWLGVGMTTLVIVWSSLTSSYITEIELNCAIIMDVQKRCVDLIMPWWSPSSKDWLQEWRSGLCSSLYLNLFCPWLWVQNFSKWPTCCLEEVGNIQSQIVNMVLGKPSLYKESITITFAMRV